MFETILIFLVMLSVLVLIHELGHFVLAKLFGIKVEEFGFGFPPRVFGKRYGETLYSFNALPIGGFVKLYGEDEAGAGRVQIKNKKSNLKSENLERAFFAKPIWQRASVVIAGVVMNFLLAVAVITYLFTFDGIPVPGNQVVISEVVKGSPAELAGLRQGDVILKINNISITDSQILITQTRKHLGKPITLEIRNPKSEIRNFTIIPRKDYPVNQGPMGVAISQSVELKKYPFPKSLFFGLKQAANDSWLVVIGFKDVLVNIATRLTIPAGVAGPIGMAQLTGEFVRVGPSAVLGLVYMLSLSLAVLNILPIPALDGGRFFFILVEAVTRRKVNPRFEAMAHVVGLVLLLTFLALVSYKDILRIIAGQSILPQ